MTRKPMTILGALLVLSACNGFVMGQTRSSQSLRLRLQPMGEDHILGSRGYLGG